MPSVADPGSSLELSPVSQVSHIQTNRETIPRSSRLLALPAELKLIIIKFLNDDCDDLYAVRHDCKVDLTCLLLTCRHMYAFTRFIKVSLRNHYRKPSPGTLVNNPTAVRHYVSRLYLLDRLCCDAKLDYIVCRACEILHPLAPYIQPPTPERFQFDALFGADVKNCPALLEGVGPVWWNKWKLSFVDIYLAMLGHHLGKPHSQPLCSLSFSTDWTHRPIEHKPSEQPANTVERRYTYEHAPYHYVKLDMAASVESDTEMIIHTTQRLWIPLAMPEGKTFHFEQEAPDGMNLTTGFQLCKHAHLDPPPKNSENQTDGLLVAAAIAVQLGYIYRMRTSNTPPSPSASKPVCCNMCHTTFKLNVLDHGQHGIEIILDTWQGVGWCKIPSNRGWAACWRAAKTTEEHGAGITYGVGSGRPPRGTSALTATETSFHPAPLGVPGRSALDHESAAAVLEHFAKIRGGDQ